MFYVTRAYKARQKSPAEAYNAVKIWAALLHRIYLCNKAMQEVIGNCQVMQQMPSNVVLETVNNFLKHPDMVSFVY
ncbi:MAG TPA: hypothetical protein ACHBZA_12835 [Arsenophonus apicola]